MSITNTCQDIKDDQDLALLMKNNFVNKKLSIYLVNGIKMSGFMTNFQIHKYIILTTNLEEENEHMIFWSAIATITHQEEQCSINYNKKKHQDNVFSILEDKIIKVFLCNGIKLQGTLKNYLFKEYIIIERDEHQQLILWNAIVTISPVETSNINLHFMNRKEELSSEMQIDLLQSLMNKGIVIFLKNGIKLTGTLTSSFYESNSCSHIIIDKSQLISIQHVSTIAKS